MNFFLKADKILGVCEEFVSAMAMLFMCLVVFVGVLYRSVLALPFPTSEEIARYMMVYCIYVGMSVATRKKAHITVDAFVGMLPDKAARVLRMIAQIITIATFAWLFVLAVRWIGMSTGPNPQRTPLTRIPYWYLYMSLAIGFSLSVLRGAQVFYKDFIYKGGNTPKDEELIGKGVVEE